MCQAFMGKDVQLFRGNRLEQCLLGGFFMPKYKERQVIIIVIKNSTQNTVLATKARLAEKAIKRIKGLLGEKGLSQEEGLIIYPCKQIHSFFMKFSFDALFLDPDFNILHIEKAIPPFRISPMIKGSYIVVELPAGTAEKTGTEVGDKIVFKGAA